MQRFFRQMCDSPKETNKEFIETKLKPLEIPPNINSHQEVFSAGSPDKNFSFANHQVHWNDANGNIFVKRHFYVGAHTNCVRKTFAVELCVIVPSLC